MRHLFTILQSKIHSVHRNVFWRSNKYRNPLVQPETFGSLEMGHMPLIFFFLNVKTRSLTITQG